MVFTEFGGDASLVLSLPISRPRPGYFAFFLRKQKQSLQQR